jgi:hypothetical protein
VAEVVVDESQEKSISISLTLTEAEVLKTILGRFAAGTGPVESIYAELDDAGVETYSNLLITSISRESVFGLEVNE